MSTAWTEIFFPEDVIEQVHEVKTAFSSSKYEVMFNFMCPLFQEFTALVLQMSIKLLASVGTNKYR
jgi:hypothetical protein